MINNINNCFRQGQIDSMMTSTKLLSELGLYGSFRGCGWRTVNIEMTVYIANEVSTTTTIVTVIILFKLSVSESVIGPDS
jgi:hypothetical protein